MSLKAIDISTYQGDVNMKRVRDEAGVQRIILRAGYGKDNTDQKFTRNAEAMINLNIPGGIYWFSYALNVEMAKNEGIFAVRHAKKYWDKCAIAFDFEYDSVNYCRKNGVSVTKQLATQMALAFLTEVSNAGYVPVLYLNQDYWNNYFDVNKIKEAIPGLKIWYACWYNSNKTDVVTPLPASIKKNVDIWQYSSKGQVPGISGNVDMDDVYFEDEAIEPVPVNPSTVTPNVNISNFQLAANKDGYSKKAIAEDLAVDGIDGPKTQAVRKTILLKVYYKDGYPKVKCAGDVVAWVQTRLKEMGLDPGEVDGLYGAKTEKAVRAFQTKNNLVVDGIAGYNTLSMMFYV